MNNMQKHKNNSGFTLVELIVVMCIMGIIMGAVLNFLRPTAQLYNTTNKYLNQEEAVDMIADYLKDDLMYATGAVIVESNQADINAVAQRFSDAAAANPSMGEFDYKNCIVLDNASIRSSGTAAAIRKEATGTITKYALKNEHFVDVASDDSLLQGKELYRNTFALQDQSFMGEDQYRFSVIDSGGDPALGTMAHLTIHIEVSSLVRDPDTDTYKVHETEFEADKPIEFLNSTSSIVTNGFNVWTDAGEYSGDDYIYIFYNRKDKITQDNICFTCEFYLMGSDGKYMDDPIYTRTVVDPADLREEVQKMVEMKNLEMIEDTMYVYRRTGLYADIKDVYDKDSVHVVDLSNITGGTPGETRRLYAVYTRTLKSDEKHSVRFYHNKDDATYFFPVNDIIFGGDITDQVPEWAGETDNGDGSYTIRYWASRDTDLIQESFEHITSDLEVYEASYKEYKVSFVKQDGTPAEWTDSAGNVVDYIRVREGGTIDATLMPKASDYKDPSDDPSGSYIWVFDGGDYDGQAINNTEEIKEPTTLKVQFVPAPVQPPLDTQVDHASNTEYHDGGNRPSLSSTFTLTNNTGSDITGKIKIVITYSQPIKLIGYSSPTGESNVITKLEPTINGNELTLIATISSDPEEWKHFYNTRTIKIYTNSIVFDNVPEVVDYTVEVIS